MIADITRILAALTLVSVVAYLVFALVFALHARRAIVPDAPPSDLPPAPDFPGVSILKPCAGADDDLESCLRSFCMLRYPRFEILCGVRDDGDAALPVLERVRAAFPTVAFRVVRTRSGRSANPKVAQLEVLERAATFDTLWISDSNTRVHPDTLTSMARDLARPGVGLVLSPIVGTDEATLGAALDNLQISSFVTFASIGVYTLTGRLTAPGKSALVRRRSLQAIGGFDDLGRYGAEDYLLVERLRARGERVVIGEHLVANVNVSTDVKTFYRRHLRWAQLSWSLEWGTALEVFMYPVLFALVWFVSAPSAHALAVLASVAALQSVVDLWVLARMRGRGLRLRHLLRPVIFAWMFTLGLFVRRVVWRGNVRWLGEETLLLESPRVGLARLLRTR